MLDLRDKENWVRRTDLNLIFNHLVTGRQKVSPGQTFDMLLLPHVPLESLGLDQLHFPESYQPTPCFLQELRPHMQCVVDFLV